MLFIVSMLGIGKTILSKEKFQLTIDRLCYQLIENYDDFNDTCIIGIQEKGVLLANRILKTLDIIQPNLKYKVGKLDISFFRDDFRRRENPISPSITEMNFLVEDKKVIIIDDVLYTGRTIHAAMSAIQNFGRPSKVELLCMVDRRFNRHLPIQPNYVGIVVDSIDEAFVRVLWHEDAKEDKVLLYTPKATQ